MLLSPLEAALYSKLHRSLMCFVNEQLRILPGIDSLEKFASLSGEEAIKVRNAWLENPDLTDSFVAANPLDFTPAELGIVASWRHRVAGKYFILRYLKNYAIFLSTEEPATAYGVVGLNSPFENLVGPYLPTWVETVLLPFQDKIVHDGLLNRYSITFGPGIRHSLNESYKAAKQRLGIVTTLPIGARPATDAKPPKKRTPKQKPATTADAKAVQQVVGDLVEQFCREHLNEEYAGVCLKLVEKLARKRPSPLLSGRPTTWACGVVRAIGWANFLDDRTGNPYMKLTAIDKAFGVAENTGQEKSKLIRRLFKIRQFDQHWTLPSRMDDSGPIWMLQVNGFMLDIRDCPREIQAVAFEKGLIPYIPADRD